MLDLGTTDVIPLSELSLSREIGPIGIDLRRFGLTEGDLAVDFLSTDRASLATRLLELCTPKIDGLPDGVFIDLSIGKRIELLLLLAFGAEGSIVPLLFTCSSCSEELEIELELAEISNLQRSSDEFEMINVRLDEQTISFRKPTGRDQEIWAETIFRDEKDASREMIDSLTDDPESLRDLAPDAFLEIENALDEADPLVNFSCVITCEVCGVQAEHDVDLLEIALEKLWSAQNELLLMVHRLASRYHWSEKEIFAIPHVRRLQYLSFIDEGIK